MEKYIRQNYFIKIGLFIKIKIIFNIKMVKINNKNIVKIYKNIPEFILDADNKNR